MNKKITLSIIIFMGLLFLITPDDTFAQYSHSKAHNTCDTHDDEWDTACKTNYGINITATDYNRITTQHTNNVGNRTITISANKDAVYRIRIIYGSIDSIEKMNDTTSLSDLDDEVESDDNLKMKKTTMKNGSYSWALPAGKEALVIVSLAGQYKNSAGNKVDYKWDSGETCTTGTGNNKKTHKVLCKAGNAVVENGEVELKGVSASLYVENPNDSGLVSNIRSVHGVDPYNKACKNAKKGIYANSDDEKDNNKKEYTKNAENNKAAWENLYTKVLGDYCESESFAYNLKRSQIRKISNRLLEVFYYQTKYDTINDNYSEVDNEIKRITAEIEQEKEEQKDNSNRIFSGETKPEISTSCDKSEKQIGSKQYLYTTNPKTVKTEKLSNGRKYKVCKVICYEHLKVIYDPPVASAAGLCFTYKVTVQSETKCGTTKEREYEDALLNKKACSPVPICSNNEKHTQAGPSEDFDKCIEKCDEGKYSQNCINKCYKKVYENKSKKTNTTNSNKSITKNTSSSGLEAKANASVSNLAQINNKYKIMKLATSEYKEDYLKEYYKENNNNECTTQKIKEYFENESKYNNNIEKCAEYFFYAKSLFPYGKYTSGGTNWSPFNNITDAGATEEGTTNIPMQIGRASPFYLRDEKSTRNLLKSLVGYNDGLYKKYNIKANGIKRQYSKRYKCDESCKYTGCNEGDALSASDYTDKSAEDLRKIKDALKDCTTTAACDTETTTTTFNIQIKNNRKGKTAEENEKEAPTRTGTTEVKHPEKNTKGEESRPEDCQSSKFTMFVPRYDEIDKSSETGILGLCYDNITDSPQYRTTITYPGSWINYKARKITYEDTCQANSELKNGYFCNAYDNENTNEDWWKWRTEMKKSDGTPYYTSAPEPTTRDNITAKASNFGKYDWTINYSCFYAVYDGIDECYSADYPADHICCLHPEKCGKTGFRDYKFDVIDSGKLFEENGNQHQGYNWTSDATVEAGIKNSNSDAQTYKINPQKYVEYIRTNEKDETLYTQSTTADDYYIYIPSEKINDIKREYKDRPYADYLGTFKEDENITGLIRYTSDVLENIRGMSGITYRKKSGFDKINNDYSNLNSLLGK